LGSPDWLWFVNLELYYNQLPEDVHGRHTKKAYEKRVSKRLIIELKFYHQSGPTVLPGKSRAVSPR
jgi:hypothetical protein